MMCVYCVCVYVCVVAAVAQREQLHSAPHTSFVSGLSCLANRAPPSPKPSPRTGTREEHLETLGVAPGQNLVSL